METPPTTDGRDLQAMSRSECYELLRSRRLGRLAYGDDLGPVVVPVNHLVVGPDLVLHSLHGHKLRAAIQGAPVAFEVDDHDPDRGSGWSVLLRGNAYLVDSTDEVERYHALLRSWAVPSPGAGTWVRIVTEDVAGRRLASHRVSTGSDG